MTRPSQTSRPKGMDGATPSAEMAVCVPSAGCLREMPPPLGRRGPPPASSGPGGRQTAILLAHRRRTWRRGGSGIAADYAAVSVMDSAIKTSFVATVRHVRADRATPPTEPEPTPTRPKTSSEPDLSHPSPIYEPDLPTRVQPPPFRVHPPQPEFNLP